MVHRYYTRLDCVQNPYLTWSEVCLLIFNLVRRWTLKPTRGAIHSPDLFNLSGRVLSLFERDVFRDPSFISFLWRLFRFKIWFHPYRKIRCVRHIIPSVVLEIYYLRLCLMFDSYKYYFFISFSLFSVLFSCPVINFFLSLNFLLYAPIILNLILLPNFCLLISFIWPSMNTCLIDLSSCIFVFYVLSHFCVHSVLLFVDRIPLRFSLFTL